MATIFTVTRDIEVEGSNVEVEVTASHDEGSEYESFTLSNVGEKVLDEYPINIDQDDIEEMDEDEVVALLTSLNSVHPKLMQRIKESTACLETQRLRRELGFAKRSWGQQVTELTDKLRKVSLLKTEPAEPAEPAWQGSEEAHLREPLLKCNLSAEEFEMNAVNVGELASWLLHPENDGKLNILIEKMLDSDLSKTRTALITAVAKHLGGM